MYHAGVPSLPCCKGILLAVYITDPFRHVKCYVGCSSRGWKATAQGRLYVKYAFFISLTTLRSFSSLVDQHNVTSIARRSMPLTKFTHVFVFSCYENHQALAKKNGVQIFTHKVIYRFLDDVKMVMSDLLPPDVKETVLGEGDILEVCWRVRSKVLLVLAVFIATSSRRGYGCVRLFGTK